MWRNDKISLKKKKIQYCGLSNYFTPLNGFILMKEI